jgi:hypothetical protein
MKIKSSVKNFLEGFAVATFSKGDDTRYGCCGIMPEL